MSDEIVVVEMRDAVPYVDDFANTYPELFPAPPPGFARPRVDRVFRDLSASDAEPMGASEFAGLRRFFQIRSDGAKGAADLVSSLVADKDRVRSAYVQTKPGGAPRQMPFIVADIWQEWLKLRDKTGFRSIWSEPGGKGKCVSVVDLESDWNPKHPDLPNITHLSGAFSMKNVTHGTCTLLTLAAIPENQFEGDGLCPDAAIHTASREQVQSDSIPNALHECIKSLKPGDIVLLEVEAGSNVGGGKASQPIEFETAVLAAIREADFRNIFVIEPAGNSGMDVDPYVRGCSGAIMVGASSLGRRLLGSNWGTRVDCHLENSVSVFLEEGSAFSYTDTSGTSAAIAGLVACLQGVARQRGKNITPTEFRRWLWDDKNLVNRINFLGGMPSGEGLLKAVKAMK